LQARTSRMASSLSPQCTPLKHAYDQCFNSWFEGYLQPATQESSSNTPSDSAKSSSSGVSSSTSRKAGNGINQHSTSKEEARRAYSKRKAEEFEEKCGKVWKSYRTCIAKAVTEKGLDALLDQARRENPLRDPEPDVPSPTESKTSTTPPGSALRSKQTKSSPIVEEFESTPGL